MIAYKGFNQNLTCDGVQFEIGETYTLSDSSVLEIGKSGYQFCSSILDVFHYYNPNNSRYCEVEILGDVKWNENQSRAVTNKIKIIKELNIDDILYFYQNEKQYDNFRRKTGDNIVIRSKEENTKTTLRGNGSILNSTKDDTVNSSIGDRNISASTGDKSTTVSDSYNGIAASSSYDSLILSCKRYSIAANTGLHNVIQAEEYNSIAANTFYDSLIKTKSTNSIAACTGYNSKIEVLSTDSIAVATGHHDTAISYDKDSIAAVTNHSNIAIVKNEKSIAVATNKSIAYAESPDSIAISNGEKSSSKGVIGSWLVLTERDNTGTIIDIKSIKVDGINIKENTEYYLLNGTITEVNNDNN